MNGNSETICIDTDLLIIGGGTAGCFAAVTAKEKDPSIQVLIMEKAHIERSGCLAAGINAINAYLNPGETPETFLDYVKKDSAGLVRDDLVYTIALGLNEVTRKVESWGLPILKDAAGNYVARGKRSIRINGERIKPILARAAIGSGARILNRVMATNYLMVEDRVAGAYGIGVRDGKFYIIRAKAVICATGGAAGIYGPNNPGSARHKLWYSPFNTGTGYAMGIRAGAEMTSLEMRFIALRVKDTIAPTGTLAQGVKAVQINGQGEPYLNKAAKVSTPLRLQATLEENQAGRGPCYLDTSHLTGKQANKLKEAYLNMCPGMVLAWADYGVEPTVPVEICGTEPYIAGGHTQSGYWIDVHRRTTLKGLYASGDVAGGAPKKYVTGCFVEGQLAARNAVDYLKNIHLVSPEKEQVAKEVQRVLAPLARERGFNPHQLEEALQKIMDDYAGGIAENYGMSAKKLEIARGKLKKLHLQTQKIAATDLHQLMMAHETIDRIYVAKVLIEHLLYRQETRWPCYQTRLDYPDRDDGNWLKFVNSRYHGDTDEIEVLERPYPDSFNGNGVDIWG